jgi:hypothetical protein
MNRPEQPSDQITQKPRDRGAERLADIHGEDRETSHGRNVDIRIDRPDPEQFVRREILLTAEKMFARELERSKSDAAFCRSIALVASGACIVLAIVSLILWLGVGR